ncbi:hypothetical protein [Bosea sp. (in: a-proteobacteria)]|uniref:hypothetical protein n=1 Tax=Bosea sp. (in: a-proteobacteria) TaxID=1871050 RepID=UPI003F710BAF
MRPPKNKWPDTDGSRGVLMFAQLMSEMLEPSTFESFRVFSLDTNARLREALQQIGDVRRQRVPKVTLDPIMEELDWSFTKDSAATSLASLEIGALKRVAKDKNTSLEDFRSHIRLVRKLTSDSYKRKIEDLLINIFDKPNEKIELRKLTGFYCSHIVNIGYSRKHISETVQRYFFETDIRRIGRATLTKFFREFDGKEKKFNVHATVTKDLGKYLKGLGFQIKEKEQLNPEQLMTLSQNINYADTPSALEIIVDEYDPHGAMDYCYQILSAQRAIAYLDPHGMHSEWGDTMHVTRLRAQSGAAVSKTDLFANRTDAHKFRSNRRASIISNYAQGLFRNFDPPSTERLISSIRTAALARTSLNPENQIISLWSAIEVLLSDPQGESRIVHYAKLITPCIVLRHNRRQVIAIYDNLLINYRYKLNKLLRKLPNFPNIHGHTAFAELMLLPEHAQLRIELCSILAKNPLALHRVWKLQDDHKDVDSAYRHMCDHFDRVRWQIHRIYRARNQLVHSGRMPSYLESLILNLAEYYRSSITTIVERSKRERERSNIDQTVAEIGIRYGILRSHFNIKNGNKPLDLKHVAMLMDDRNAWQ